MSFECFAFFLLCQIETRGERRKGEKRGKVQNDCFFPVEVLRTKWLFPVVEIRFGIGDVWIITRMYVLLSISLTRYPAEYCSTVMLEVN